MSVFKRPLGWGLPPSSASTASSTSASAAVASPWDRYISLAGSPKLDRIMGSTSSSTSSSPASSSSARLFRKSAESDDSGINRDEYGQQGGGDGGGVSTASPIRHLYLDEEAGTGGGQVIRRRSSSSSSSSVAAATATPSGPRGSSPSSSTSISSSALQTSGGGDLDHSSSIGSGVNNRPSDLPSGGGGGGTELLLLHDSSSTSSEQKLLDLTLLSGYNMVQRNGQRIYGGPPPGWTGPPPSKGSEIFVGKVPRDCYEDELVPIFEKMGRIYELRLMMDFSGSNRGYFFVRYTCREDAKRATRELNNYEIRPGKYLGVIWSVDNRKLWISGIPKDRSPAEIKAGMEQLTDGVRDVILYPSKNDKSKNRGYAFVEYESHRAAALARRKLVPGNVFLLDHEIEKVDWAEPENEVDEDVISKVRILFVRNLMSVTTEDDIQAVFDRFTGGSVERVKKTMNYAFVHFGTREAAEVAMEKARGLVLDDSEVEVSWSRPVDKDAHKTRKVLSKALTSPNGTVALDQSLSSVLGGQTVASLRGIAPRKRGAAGVKGLGAPGTAPPAALLRKLVGSGGGAASLRMSAESEEDLFEHRHRGGGHHHSAYHHHQHQQQLLHQNHHHVLPFGGLLPPPLQGPNSMGGGGFMGGNGDWGGGLQHQNNLDMLSQAFSGIRLVEGGGLGGGGGGPFNGGSGVGANNGGAPGLDHQHHAGFSGSFLGVNPSGGGGFYKGFNLVDPAKFVSFFGGGGLLDPSMYQNGLMVSGGGFVPPQHVFQHLGGGSSASGFCHSSSGGEGHLKCTNNNHHHHHHHQQGQVRGHPSRPFHSGAD